MTVPHFEVDAAVFDVLERAQDMGFAPALEDPMSFAMDISAAASKVNGNDGFSISALKDADDGTFIHDIVGIHNHINRRTGKLENCFLPRVCSQ